MLATASRYDVCSGPRSGITGGNAGVTGFSGKGKAVNVDGLGRFDCGIQSASADKRSGGRDTRPERRGMDTGTISGGIISENGSVACGTSQTGETGVIEESAKGTAGVTGDAEC